MIGSAEKLTNGKVFSPTCSGSEQAGCLCLPCTVVVFSRHEQESGGGAVLTGRRR
jgi:hypothetical protein